MHSWLTNIVKNTHLESKINYFREAHSIIANTNTQPVLRGFKSSKVIQPLNSHLNKIKYVRIEYVFNFSFSLSLKQSKIMTYVGFIPFKANKSFINTNDKVSNIFLFNFSNIYQKNNTATKNCCSFLIHADLKIYNLQCALS